MCTFWNLLEWFLRLQALEAMPQKVVLVLNNLVKWNEMSIWKDNVLITTTWKVLFCEDHCVSFCKVTQEMNSLIYMKFCYWTKCICELKIQGNNVLAKDYRWKICPSTLTSITPHTVLKKSTIVLSKISFILCFILLEN